MVVALPGGLVVFARAAPNSMHAQLARVVVALPALCRQGRLPRPSHAFPRLPTPPQSFPGFPGFQPLVKVSPRVLDDTVLASAKVACEKVWN